jgi:tetratricopeptide (TPR) repeat protein
MSQVPDAQRKALPARPRPWRLVVALLVLGAAGGWLLVHLRQSDPAARSHASPDPRLTYGGPYRNVHPDVAYAGDAQCASCHAEIADSFRRHPMGMSLAPIGEVADREVYDTAHNNPFTFLGSRFEVERRGREVHHRESRLDAAGRPVFTLDSEVHFAVGSGTRGRSYLTDRGGYLFQTPVSWFGQKQRWDGSPGFYPGLLNGRPVHGECLYCHANRTRFREGSLNRFDEPVFAGHAIGCERCHGPGERHVRTGQALDVVNPGKLAPALREAVCEQCHLEGVMRILRRGRGLYDFRPGLLLEDFWAVFVYEAGKDRKAVRHVEQMHQSRCFQGSQEGPSPLGCVSCHDPHVKVQPAAQAAWYRQRCLACHDQHPCSLARADRLRQQPDDSCIACHMPRYGSSDVVHVASTDHRVVRRPSPPEGRGGSQDAGGLVFFHRSRLDGDEREQTRDEGVALAYLLGQGKEPPHRSGMQALRMLAAASERDPDDVAAREAMGTTLAALQRPDEEVLAVFRGVLDRDPEREATRVRAAGLAQKLHQWEAARADWLRAVDANPWMPGYRRQLVQVLLHLQAWDEARPQVEAWMRLDPRSVEARKAWITCLLHEGKKDAARAEFARIEALQPPEIAELRDWFARQTR